MQRKTFALGRDGQATAWCGWVDREAGKFDCYSGGYSATYLGGAVRHPIHEPVYLEIVWEGEVPVSESNDYNTAINWIQGVLNNATV